MKETERLLHELQGRIHDELEETILLIMSSKYGSIGNQAAKHLAMRLRRSFLQ